MLNIFNKFVICFFLSLFTYLGPEHVEFHLVEANKVDLNQMEGNGGFNVENKRLIKSNNQTNNHINLNIKYSDYYGNSFPGNSSISADQELNSNGSNITNNENRQLYIDSNGSISSIKNNLETNSSIGGISNNSNQYQLEPLQNEQVISEHFDNHANLQYNSTKSFTNITTDKIDHSNFNTSSNEKIRYDTLQAINNSFNVLTVDFSVIYDDLTFEPNLKSNVEYTIFNISNTEVKNKIEKEIKTNNDGNFVINLRDYSSYGFVTWIKPLESNSTEVILQSNSGIMPNMKIKLLEKLFPRRNFTSDELDIIILSESRNEVRPYGYRGSPMILTQFIENIDLNNENEDFFSFIETIETLNQTSYLKSSNNSLQILDNIDKNTSFEFWNNSFLLHDNPDILSINCNYYNEWSAWSACTNECGWGVQTRGRRINANLVDNSFHLSEFEINEILRKCKAQVQTQGCTSKIGCCEYQSPKENLWNNCTASCDNYGTEEQIVDLISNKKGKVKDFKCENKKILKRKCLRLSGDNCKTCDTTQWSEWSSCNNENGDFIQKRTRELANRNCTYAQTKLEEKRICEKMPLFSTSPTANNENIDNVKQQFLISSENLNDKETINEIKECELQKSEMKYNLIEGACECPSGVNLCDNTVIENNKTSWESHLKEICDKKTDVLSDKNLMIMAKGKRLYNCKTKSWDKYVTTPDDLDCKKAFVLCKVESKCMVSSWSDWSGCSSPCKSSVNDLETTRILSTRFKTRKVVSGECKEHSLFMKEECLDIKDCPQTKFTLSIDKTPTELTNLLFSEGIKSHIKKTFNKLQEYSVQDDSVSNVAKNLFNNVRDIIIQNSEYIYKLDFNFNVFGGDGNYHIQSYINFIMSKYNFDNANLVKDIIVRVTVPSDENKEILYEKLSENDKKIIGTNKDETNEFLKSLFPSNKSSSQNKTEQESSIELGDSLTKNLNYSTHYNLDINNTHTPENFVLQKESDTFSKIINPELLFKLIQIAIVKHTNCKPTEINKQNLSESNSETKCVCPVGYTLCSSIDYYFGNHIGSSNKNGEIEIRTPEGVFSDNFVLNQGGIFDQVYEEDKEKYCGKPGAKVMCISNSELLDALKYYELKDLYSMFVRFKSAEESS
ncbi:thrombospondin type 1 domain-containing [Cryptosporidium sp. chipmunk genotype I]|uniref:thrombospondin type 1 domain-containing n=1 Tax=Cryptosporidium sp. chipmunk genotype I TaxID=1280935 RepID=UPI00351A1119|nr:thrombospondin type 1 domain-containing [Cryptosporidium sp. chipmunk genotype I]